MDERFGYAANRLLVLGMLAGHLYGMEKMWALNHYRKEGLPPLPFSSVMSEHLAKFTCIEDFRSNEVGGLRAWPRGQDYHCQLCG